MQNKIKATFRFNEEVWQILEEEAKRTGKNKTQILEELILSLRNQKDDNIQVELLEKQNFQLQNVIKSLQIALDSKDRIIEEKDRFITEIMAQKDKLIAEKDYRIKDLQEKIELLKQKNKWWKFWK